MSSPHMLEQFALNIQMLTGTWSETVEYSVEINGSVERRAVNRSYASLLVQLEQNVTEPMQQGPRGPSGPNKAGSRPPTNSQYADCIDTIQEQAFKAFDYLMDGAPEGCAKYPPHALLGLVESQVRMRCWDEPEKCHKVASAVEAMTRKARILLGYETRIITLPEVSCHRCSGTLVCAADASTDVSCIDCGTGYDRLRWIDLL